MERCGFFINTAEKVTVILSWMKLNRLVIIDTGNKIILFSILCSCSKLLSGHLSAFQSTRKSWQLLHFYLFTEENTAVSPAEKVQRKPDFDELQQISRLSRQLFSPDEASPFNQELRSNFRRVLENSPEDEEIIETLLDMEEDYRLNSSILHQP